MKKNDTSRRPAKPALLFLPLLLLYVLIIVATSGLPSVEDAAGYMGYAHNIVRGCYSPGSGEKTNLWWGPGYPLMLAPFVLFKAPLLAAKLLNALLLYTAVLALYAAVRLYVGRRTGLVVALLFGLYVPFFRHMYATVPEMLTVLLTCLFVLQFIKYHREEGGGSFCLVSSSLVLAYLALTKVFFGYVIPATIIALSVWWIARRKQPLLKSLLVFSLALLWCLPYLIYSYSLTGKMYYWGNSGGTSIYWMSSPFPDELGSYFGLTHVRSMPQLKRDHGTFLLGEGFQSLGEISRDQVLKKKALENIRKYPARFVRNWVANVGRLVFQYPLSYMPQSLSTYFYLIPNMFLVVIAVLCAYPAYRARALIPHELMVLLLFAAITFAGNSLLAALTRMFFPVVPVLFVCLSFVVARLVRIEIAVPQEERLKEAA